MMKCGYYGKIGHIKVKCFEFFGYSSHWDTWCRHQGNNMYGGEQIIVVAHTILAEEEPNKKNA